MSGTIRDCWQEDRIKNILTTVKAVAAELFFVPRFFCYMKDDHSNVLEAIQYMRQTGHWLKSVAPEYKKRMKEMILPSISFRPPATIADAVEYFKQNGVVVAPSKAVNAGGVAVSGLEMSQNAMHYSWTAEEVDAKLQQIMKNIYAAAADAAAQVDMPGNLVVGANIAGFLKVADAMNAQGIV